MVLLSWLACAPGLDPFTIAPAEGPWAVAFEIELDECGIEAVPEDAPLAPGVDVLWVTPEEQGFSVALAGGDPASCTLVGESFRCRPAVERARVDDDLLLSNAVMIEGWLTDGRSMDGLVIVDFKCVGADCMQFEDTWGTPAPCRVEGAFTSAPQ